MLLKIDLEVGNTLLVEKHIGEGAFSEVYRVRHRYLGRQALKLFKTPCASEAEVEERLAEAALLSHLGHPNIIRVYDANLIEIDGKPHGYFTTEYLPGGNLEEFWQISQKGVFPLDLLMEIITQITRGLAVAHQSTPPIIHRDIKPQNILIGFDGENLRAVLSDFGLAKHVNPLTLMATAMGTLPFKPPEAFQENGIDSPAGDVWGIGCCIYLLLTGRFPYHALEALNIKFFPTFKEEFIPASQFNVDVDEGLDELIRAMLEKDARRRIPDAPSLMQAIEGWRLEKKRESEYLVDAVFVDTPARKKTTDELDLVVSQAEALARFPGKLDLAAEMLASVIARDARYQDKFGSKLELWRKGLSA